MELILVCLHLFCCLFLILVVLVQAGRGGGLGALGGGGGASDSLLGTQSKSVIAKVTAVVASLFMILSFCLAYVYAHKYRSLILPSQKDVMSAFQEKQQGTNEAGASEVPLESEKVEEGASVSSKPLESDGVEEELPVLKSEVIEGESLESVESEVVSIQSSEVESIEAISESVSTVDDEVESPVLESVVSERSSSGKKVSIDESSVVSQKEKKELNSSFKKEHVEVVETSVKK